MVIAVNDIANRMIHCLNGSVKLNISSVVCSGLSMEMHPAKKNHIKILQRIVLLSNLEYISSIHTRKNTKAISIFSVRRNFVYAPIST